MTISLVKGGNVALDPGLTKINVGLGWSVRKTTGAAFDLDVCTFMLGSDGKVRSDADFIFYNQRKSKCGCVEHMGDNRVGGYDDADDETMKVFLPGLDADVDKIVFTASIHEAKERGQNFGMVGDAYIRIVNEVANEEVARFDLSEDAGTNTAVIFGELYRRNGVWKFRAVGQGFDYGLLEVARSYGVNV